MAQVNEWSVIVVLDNEGVHELALIDSKLITDYSPDGLEGAVYGNLDNREANERIFLFDDVSGLIGYCIDNNIRPAISWDCFTA